MWIASTCGGCRACRWLVSRLLAGLSDTRWWASILQYDLCHSQPSCAPPMGVEQSREGAVVGKKPHRTASSGSSYPRATDCPSKNIAVLTCQLFITVSVKGTQVNVCC